MNWCLLCAMVGAAAFVAVLLIGAITIVEIISRSNPPEHPHKDE